jgi:hypothetical protein
MYEHHCPLDAFRVQHGNRARTAPSAPSPTPITTPACISCFKTPPNYTPTISGATNNGGIHPTHFATELGRYGRSQVIRYRKRGSILLARGVRTSSSIFPLAPSDAAAVKERGRHENRKTADNRYSTAARTRIVITPLPPTPLVSGKPLLALRPRIDWWACVLHYLYSCRICAVCHEHFSINLSSFSHHFTIFHACIFPTFSVR